MYLLAAVRWVKLLARSNTTCCPPRCRFSLPGVSNNLPTTAKLGAFPLPYRVCSSPALLLRGSKNWPFSRSFPPFSPGGRSAIHFSSRFRGPRGQSGIHRIQLDWPVGVSTRSFPQVINTLIRRAANLPMLTSYHIYISLFPKQRHL